MTIETEVAALTTAVTSFSTAANTINTNLNASITAFSATTVRVDALNNVDNTTDLLKPVSTATQTALNGKQAALVDGTNISTVNGVSLTSGTPLVIARSATSLSNVTYENRSALRDTSSEIDDSIVVDHIGLFQWTNTQLEPDDDISCFNTNTVGFIGQWLLKTPHYDFINAENLFEAAIISEWMEDEQTRTATY